MRYILVAAAAASLVAGAHGAHASLALGTNLVANGGAEAGPSNGSGASVASIPSWTSSAGAMTVVPYGAAGGFPLATDPGPAARGSQFFAGNEGEAFSSITQSLSVADGAALIDGGGVSYSLSAYLGGFATQDDFASFSVTFEDAADNVIGSATLTGPNAAARSDLTGLLLVSASGFIPVDTRSLVFALGSTREEGSYDDGYADNLSFVAAGGSPVTPVAEPASAALLALGALALGAVRLHSGKRRAS